MREILFKITLSLNKTLIKFDNFLDRNRRSEVYIFYLVPVLLLSYIALELILPIAERVHLNSRNNLVALEKKIQEYKAPLSVGKSAKSILESLKNSNTLLRNKIQEKVDNSYFIEEKIESELMDIRYNKKNWSNHLSFVSDSAANLNLDIMNITNTINDNAKVDVFTPVMNFDINGSGKFLEVIKFLDTLETDRKITEITSLELVGEEKILFDVHIDIWGIK